MVPAAPRVNVEIIPPGGVSQTEKDKYPMVSLIYGTQNRTRMKLFMKERFTDTENRLGVVKG